MAKKRTRTDKIEDVVPEPGTRPPLKPLKPLTKAQESYLASIANNIVTFGIGPSGTGKTAVATMRAADEYLAGNIGKIIITRPIVEVGNTLGFLPGHVEDKHAPYLMPIYDVLEKRLGRGQLGYALKAGYIKAIPLELMRGANFDNCWVILDEAQNTTVAQMKMFLTRIGKDCRVIINGDINQTDLNCRSGLEDAMYRFKSSESIGIVTFTWDDVVRSNLVKHILMAYESPPADKFK